MARKEEGIGLILGIIVEGIVGAILLSLGIGALAASILIVFVLPALLIIFDKVIIHGIKRKEKGTERGQREAETFF